MKTLARARSSFWNHTRSFLAFRRPGESDSRLGMRLAILGPILCYLLLGVALVALGGEGEAGLGMALSYWLFIGVSQCVYLIPGICVALLTRHSGIAWGLLRGGGIIAVINVLAWGIGLYIGVC
jgi:hypothetical protein